MHRAAALAALISALALLTFLTAPADAAPPARTSIAADGYYGGVLGEVRSSKRACARNRSVVLVKRVHGGPNERIGRARAKRNGKHFIWSVRTEADGKLMARTVGHGGCANAVSAPVRSAPRGDYPVCRAGVRGFCRLDQLHFDTGRSYCPDFGAASGSCSGSFVGGPIPFCCNEFDRVFWETLPKGGRKFRVLSETEGYSHWPRWELNGLLTGPGSGDLQQVDLALYDFSTHRKAWTAITPDAEGAKRNTPGGPLHLNFENGFVGADFYLEGYLYAG